MEEGSGTTSDTASDSATPAGAPSARPKRRRLLWRVVLLGFLGLVVLVTLAPVAGWLWLTSPWGEATVRDLALKAAGDSLQGRVEVDGLALEGLLHVELRGVRLFAPGESDPVVAVERARLEVGLSALLTRRIDVELLDVDRPALHLRPMGEGTNLTAALASKTPATTGPSTASSPLPDLAFRVGALKVRGGAFSQAGATPLALDGLNLDAAAAGTLNDFGLTADAAIDVHAPVERHVAAKLDGRYDADGDVLARRLEVVSGGTKLVANGRVRTQGFDEGRVGIEELVVAAADFNALPAEYRGDQTLLGDVRASGQASLEGSVAKVDLKAQLPGEGALDVSGSLALGVVQASDWSLHVTAKDVRPHRIVEGLPDAKVNLVVDGKGKGLPPNETGHVTLDASGSRYLQLVITKATATADVDGLEALIRASNIEVAGARARATGKAGAERGALQVTLDVPDVATTRLLVARGLNLQLPMAEGDLNAELDVTGRWAKPSFEGQIRTKRLMVAGTEVRDVSGAIGLEAWPPAVQASADLRIGALKSGSITGQALQIAAEIDGQTVTADADGVLAGADVDLKVRGVRLPAPKRGVEKWRVDTLQGTALGLATKLLRPATIEVAGPRYTVHDLELQGDLGLIRLDGSGGTTGPIDARLSIAGLRIEKVPRSLLPETFDAGGELSLELTAGGTAKDPVLDAVVQLADGRWQQFGPVYLASTLHADPEKLQAKGDVRVPGNGLGRFDVRAPTRIARDASAPIEADVALSHVDVSAFVPLVPALADAGGFLSGTVRAQGTLGTPTLDVDATLVDGRWDRFDALDAKLKLALASQVMKVSGTLRRPRSLGVTLDATAPFRLDEWVSATPPDPMTLPLEAQAKLETLDLAWLQTTGLGVADLEGLVAGQASFKGTGADPRGTGLFRLSRAAYGGFDQLETEVSFSLADTVEAKVLASHAGKPLGNVTARLPTTVRTLLAQDRPALGKQKFALEGHVSQTALSELQALVDASSDAQVDGDFSADFVASGTPDAPTLRVDARVPKVSLRGEPVGQFVLALLHEGRATTLDAAFESVKAGSLTVKSKLDGELGLAALERAQAKDPEASVSTVLFALPAESTLRADAFDLSVANGFTEFLTALAGTLTGEVRQTGTFAAPKVQGGLTLANGRIATAEYGDYQAVAAALSVDGTRLTLSKLAGRSRGGTFDGSADVSFRNGLQSAQGTVDFATKDLPIIQNQQTAATLSVKSHLDWKLANRVVRGELTLKDGYLRLPDKLPKDVQSLDPHPDVVVVGQDRKTAEEAAGPGYRAELTITIPDNNFRFDAPQGADVWIGMRLQVAVADRPHPQTGSAISITDELRILRGTVELYGRRFILDPASRVTFMGVDYTDPALAVKATYTGKDNTVVDVDIGGTAMQPKLTFTSPPLDEAEVLYYLATGQKQTRAQEQGVSLADQLTNSGLSLLTSRLSGRIDTGGALDTLAFEGDIAKAGESTSVGAKLRAGKYITDRFYVGGSLRGAFNGPTQIGGVAPNTVEAEFDYRFSDSMSLNGRVGDQGHSKVDVQYQVNLRLGAQAEAAAKAKGAAPPATPRGRTTPAPDGESARARDEDDEDAPTVDRAADEAREDDAPEASGDAESPPVTLDTSGTKQSP